MAFVIKLLIGIFTAGVSHASGLTCRSGKIETLEFGRTKTETADYCFNADKTVLLSKSCDQKKCRAVRLAIQGREKYKIQDLSSQFGKPGFKLCRKLGGQPAIINFYVDGKSYKLDRCTFTDGGFADTGYLLSLYLQR